MLFERLMVEGRVTHYAAAGDARAQQTLVLIHGFPLGVRMWKPQLVQPGLQLDVPAGPSRWRLLAPSLPGYDGSESMAHPSMDDYARHVLAFLDLQGVATAVVAGLSMGGYVAFALLRLAAHRVSGLVLADTRSGVDGEQARAGRYRMIEMATAGGARAAADDLLPKLFGPTTMSTDRKSVVEGKRG